MDTKQHLKGFWKRSAEHFRLARPKNSPRVSDGDRLSGTLSPTSSECSLQTIDDDAMTKNVRKVRFRFYESFSLTTIEHKLDPRDIKLITQSDHLIQRILREERSDIDRSVQWLGHLLTWRKQTGIHNLSLAEFDEKLLNMRPVEFVHGGNLDILVCGMARLVKITELIGVVRVNRLLVCYFEKLFAGGATRNLTLVAHFGQLSEGCWAKLSNRHLLNELICGCAYFRYPGFVEKVIFLDWRLGVHGKQAFQDTIARDWPNGIKDRIVFADHRDVSKAVSEDADQDNERISPDDLCIQSVLYLLSEPSIMTYMDSCSGDSEQINVNLKINGLASGPSQLTLRSSTINSASEFSSRLTTSAKDTTSNGTATHLLKPVSPRPPSRHLSAISPKHSSVLAKKAPLSKIQSGKTMTRASSVKSAESSRIPEFINNRTYIVQTRPRSGPGSDPGPPVKRDKELKKSEVPQDCSKSMRESTSKKVEIVFETVKPLIRNQNPTPVASNQQLVLTDKKGSGESLMPKPKPKERLKITAPAMVNGKNVLNSPTHQTTIAQQSPRKAQALELNSISKISGDSVGFKVDKADLTQSSSRSPRNLENAKGCAEVSNSERYRTRPNEPLNSLRRPVNVPEILQGDCIHSEDRKVCMPSPRTDTEITPSNIKELTPRDQTDPQNCHAVPNRNHKSFTTVTSSMAHPESVTITKSAHNGIVGDLSDRKLLESQQTKNSVLQYVSSERGKLNSNITNVLNICGAEESRTSRQSDENPHSGQKEADSSKFDGNSIVNESELRSEFADIRTLQSELNEVSDSSSIPPPPVLKLDRTFTSVRPEPLRSSGEPLQHPTIAVNQSNHSPKRTTAVTSRITPRKSLESPKSLVKPIYSPRKMDTSEPHNSHTGRILTTESENLHHSDIVSRDLPSIVSSGQLHETGHERTFASIERPTYLDDDHEFHPDANLQKSEESYQSEHFSKFIRSPAELPTCSSDPYDFHCVADPPCSEMPSHAIRPAMWKGPNSDLAPPPAYRRRSVQKDHTSSGTRITSPVMYEYQLRPRPRRTDPVECSSPDEGPSPVIHRSRSPYYCVPKRVYRHRSPSVAKSECSDHSEQYHQHCNAEHRYYGRPVCERRPPPHPAGHPQHIALSAYYAEESTHFRERHIVRRVESREFEYETRPHVMAPDYTDDPVYGKRRIRLDETNQYEVRRPGPTSPAVHSTREHRDAATSTHQTRVVKSRAAAIDPKTILSISELPVIPEARYLSRVARTVRESLSNALLPDKKKVADRAENHVKFTESALQRGFVWLIGLSESLTTVRLWCCQTRLFLWIICSLMWSSLWRHRRKTIPLIFFVMSAGLYCTSPELISSYTPSFSWFKQSATTDIYGRPEDHVPFFPRALLDYWSMGSKGERDSREPSSKPSEVNIPPESTTLSDDSKSVKQWPLPFGSITQHDPACTEVEDSGPREILAGWTMGNILRLGTKKLCADAKKTIADNVATVQPERSIPAKCSAFDASCLWRTITVRFNP